MYVKKNLDQTQQSKSWCNDGLNHISFNWTFRDLRFKQLSASEKVKLAVGSSATSLQFFFLFLNLKIILGNNDLKHAKISNLFKWTQILYSKHTYWILGFNVLLKVLNWFKHYKGVYIFHKRIHIPHDHAQETLWLCKRGRKE